MSGGNAQAIPINHFLPVVCYQLNHVTVLYFTVWLKSSISTILFWCCCFAHCEWKLGRVPVPAEEAAVLTYLLTDWLTYLTLSPLPGYRPSTRDLQSTLSCAFASNWFQVMPILLVSARRSRRQVFLGLPLLLLPWGFQGKNKETRLVPWY